MEKDSDLEPLVLGLTGALLGAMVGVAPGELHGVDHRIVALVARNGTHAETSRYAR